MRKAHILRVTMQATDAATPPSYRFPAIAHGYDAVNALLWLPRGSRALRAAFVDALAVRPGERALDVGCGTGQVTARLLAAGARVTALDQSSSMLARARRRAPGARYIESDVAGLDALGDPSAGEDSSAPTNSFDVITIAFLLHELPADRRVATVRAAAARLAPGGRLGILDWSLPAGRIARTLWRPLIQLVEGRRAIVTVDDLLPAVTAAGRTITARAPLAGGRAAYVIAH
jgi:ubiquinone/menaquinone biosynthesis C-methylase UbiE